MGAKCGGSVGAPGSLGGCSPGDVDVSENGCGAFRSERLGGGEAEAARAAGDEGGLACNVGHSAKSFSRVRVIRYCARPAAAAKGISAISAHLRLSSPYDRKSGV